MSLVTSKNYSLQEESRLYKKFVHRFVYHFRFLFKKPKSQGIYSQKGIIEYALRTGYITEIIESS